MCSKQMSVELMDVELRLRVTKCSSYPGWGPGPGRAWAVCRAGRRPWQPRTRGGRSPAHSGPLGSPAGGSPPLLSGTLDEMVMRVKADWSRKTWFSYEFKKWQVTRAHFLVPIMYVNEPETLRPRVLTLLSRVGPRTLDLTHNSVV